MWIAASAIAKVPLILPTILLPAPVTGTTVGAAELPEVEAPPALGMAVNSGARHNVVGADVRVTNWLVEVDVGSISGTLAIALAAIHIL